METAWMGRYRGLISELIKHSNITSKAMSIKTDFDGVMMSTLEWQVLEYVVEHRFDDDRMIHISESLEIPQSTFSRTVKSLCNAGLVEKYQMTNNRKNIILKPSQTGIDLYKSSFEKIAPTGFNQFFNALEGLSDSEIEVFTNALHVLNDNLKSGLFSSDTDIQLVKLK